MNLILWRCVALFVPSGSEKIVHIEQDWNVNEERWHFVPDDVGISREMLMDTNMEWQRWMTERESKLREEDTNWKRWLLGRSDRPSIRTFIWNSGFTGISLPAFLTSGSVMVAISSTSGRTRLTRKAW